MNMSIPEVITTMGVGFFITVIFLAMFFGFYSCEKLPSDQEVCVTNGGSWVVSEKSEGRSMDYECVMP